ncbi:tyrosine-type recombinase/integrase [Piscinibacter koreensis]|uniref:tyrosine-type recombinase/integrase n=1 Tax=Piscinibacter koreensis TaxID=2742824 RepID=UPI003CC91F8B
MGASPQDLGRWASAPTGVTLAAARELAREQRAHGQQGRDPIVARSSARSAATAERRAQQTFAEIAAHYIRQHSPGWRNPKHVAQWGATLRTYAEPVIGDLAVRNIGTEHIIRILEPIWMAKTETASRVRSRIELVLDFAAARGLRESPNPALWRGNLDAALPKAAKVAKVRHHAAVPVEQVAEVMSQIRRQHGVAARALEFAILTAARSGEVRGVTWSEVDLERGIG